MARRREPGTRCRSRRVPSHTSSQAVARHSPRCLPRTQIASAAHTAHSRSRIMPKTHAHRRAHTSRLCEHAAMTFDRQEIEDAFARYRDAAGEAGRTGNWQPWVDCFTEDCSYVEHMYGTFRGRQKVLDWITP